MIYMHASSSEPPNLGPWWGNLTTPRRGGDAPIQAGRVWGIDNGVFTGAFDPDELHAKLERLRPYRARCRFAVAPDIMRDAAATLERFREWAPQLHALGYPVAIVAQDGMTPADIPACADALFVGGSDEWRHEHAPALMYHARARNLWVHVGRVNSVERIRWCIRHGANSCDGTHHAFGGLWRTVSLFDPVLRDNYLTPTRQGALL